MGARILYHLVAPLDVVVGPGEVERRRAFLARCADPRTRVEVRTPRLGRSAIEGAWDAALVAPHIVEGIRTAEAEGFDAAIVGCFSDPALDAVREAVDIPVVGPGAASIHLALQLGDQIGVVSPGPGDPGRTRAFLRAMGQDRHLASVRGMGASVTDLASGYGDPLEPIARAARACLEDGADVLILGCMSMAFHDPTPALVARLSVPVVNPVVTALKTAETLAAHGLTASRARWPKAAVRPLIETRTIPEERGVRA